MSNNPKVLPTSDQDTKIMIQRTRPHYSPFDSERKESVTAISVVVNGQKGLAYSRLDSFHILNQQPLYVARLEDCDEGCVYCQQAIVYGTEELHHGSFNKDAIIGVGVDGFPVIVGSCCNDEDTCQYHIGAYWGDYYDDEEEGKFFILSSLQCARYDAGEPGYGFIFGAEVREYVGELISVFYIGWVDLKGNRHSKTIKLKP